MKVAHTFIAIAFLVTTALFTNPVPAAGEKTFGGAISQTGRYAEPAGRFVNSYKMFADQQNAKGGLLGQKMKLIILDDKSDK
jgi:branched-chain amino acid transport system substrate-binding protein